MTPKATLPFDKKWPIFEQKPCQCPFGKGQKHDFSMATLPLFENSANEMATFPFGIKFSTGRKVRKRKEKEK